MQFRVDIGTLEKGRVVVIDAESAQEAFDKANKLTVDSEEVVQIYSEGRCFYDAWNGFLQKQSSGPLVWCP